MVVRQLIFGNRDTPSTPMDAVKEAVLLLVSDMWSIPLNFLFLIWVLL